MLAACLLPLQEKDASREEAAGGEEADQDQRREHTSEPIARGLQITEAVEPGPSLKASDRSMARPD